MVNDLSLTDLVPVHLWESGNYPEREVGSESESEKRREAGREKWRREAEREREEREMKGAKDK